MASKVEEGGGGGSEGSHPRRARCTEPDTAPEAVGERRLRVHFVRHGQRGGRDLCSLHGVLCVRVNSYTPSENNVLAGALGFQPGRKSDPALTCVGAAQAAAAASYFRALGDRERVTHVYPSPFLRALQTAQPIAKACDAAVTVWPEVHEVGGCYAADSSGAIVGRPGMGCSEMEAAFPGIKVPDTVSEVGWYGKPKRETEDAWERRVAAVADRLRHLGRSMPAKAGKSTAVVVVCHTDFLNLLLQQVLTGGCGHTVQFVLDNCSVTTLDFHEDGDSVDVVCINRTGHLQGVTAS